MTSWSCLGLCWEIALLKPKRVFLNKLHFKSFSKILFWPISVKKSKKYFKSFLPNILAF
jgi:hypothetical protein